MAFHLFLSALLLGGAAVSLAYGRKVHRRGWCMRKEGGRILRTAQPAVFWLEIAGAMLLATVATALAGIMVLMALG